MSENEIRNAIRRFCEEFDRQACTTTQSNVRKVVTPLVLGVGLAVTACADETSQGPTGSSGTAGAGGQTSTSSGTAGTGGQSSTSGSGGQGGEAGMGGGGGQGGLGGFTSSGELYSAPDP